MESAATRALATVASGFFGLVLGSFLNVVIYRLPRSESVVSPPSRCPACGVQLGALENVPVLSWLVLRGRCAHCANPISPRYPIVELLTGALFAGIALASPSVAPLAPLDVVIAATIAIGAVDVDGERIPEILGWFALAAAAALAAVSLADHHPRRLAWAALGAAISVAAWLLSVVTGRLRGTAAAARFPGLAACAAWGWAAGWASPAGGVVVGVTLAILVLFSATRPASTWRTTAAAASVSIGTIVVGIAASH